MSIEGTKELLGAIDPDYDKVKVDESRAEIVDSTVPSERKSAFRRGYEYLKDKTSEGLKRKRNTFKKKNKPVKIEENITNEMARGATERLSIPIGANIAANKAANKAATTGGSRRTKKGGSLKRNNTVKRTFNIVRNYKE